MEKESGFFGPVHSLNHLASFEECFCASEPLVEVILCLPQRLICRQRLRFGQRMIRLLEQDYAVAHDVHEEVTAQLQLGVHIVDAVIDRADLRAQA